MISPRNIVMLRRQRRYRNYLAWRLIQEDARQQTQLRDEQRQHYLRHVIDPMDITVEEFVKRYRLTKEAFIHLCNELSSQNLIKDTQRVSLQHKVLCALAFYATGSYQHIVGMSNYVGQSTVSMYVEEVTNALNIIASNLIKFPNSPEERERIKQKFYQKYGYPGVLGCVDGCHFHIFKPKLDIEHLKQETAYFHPYNNSELT